MAPSNTPAARPTARPRKARGEGQWALGHREPLNPNERSKKDDNPLNVRARIENIYAHGGFSSIDPADLRGRFRWWGLYTQRRAGIDGGRTAVLEPEELEDEYFMLRVRIDGGALNLAQLRVIGGIATEFARDTADITDRQNIQMHWIRVEDMPEIWRRLEAVGLQTTEACGDCPRVVLGSPVAGVSADEVIDATPAIDEIVERYVGDPRYSNLPRKFKSVISWLPDGPYQANDIAFVGVHHPDHGPGFDLWVGGGLSTNPRLAERLGVWVPLAEVPDVWEGVVGIFRDYGYRRLRHRARLKFLLADWGVAKFREVLEKEYMGRALIDGPAPELPEKPLDHIGVHKQIDGRNYIGAAPVVGRSSGTQLTTLADLVEKHGSERVRLTAYQKLLVLDIADDQVEPIIEGLRGIGLEARPSAFRRGTMACTGIEYCKLAIVETKARGEELVARLEDRLKGFDAELSIHINGCPNACARTQVADIGLKGQLVLNSHGEQVEGFQIHLGGALGMAKGETAGFGRKVRGLKATAEELPEYVERVARHYLDGRDQGETFANWVMRADEELLK
ncbi:sulfite reductase (ferredoxin) [Actinoplanes campanulatus]|uniref:assimilatory sulfite reductase (ferredoxin) n=1 Tax=Actinoplanes campanulatus TaxID=113559 RepID=A0A7W5AC98_9ACTN|nr:nitrite/sulfite reductase [Actinoplanes campanulatus]MBB3093375.1 sulfite reductase (ferredoxin) [Actinoplanes campanulatus]GGN03141.1 ferredoxin--nitrite reductase [Actinoplanes campanulatus]GID33531.1 ferredoxin--nitrite reductase [Actinoplanes campanulatus]